jgi:hypothetical protein
MSRRGIDTYFQLPVILEEDEAKYYVLHDRFLAQQEEQLVHDTKAFYLQVDLWRKDNNDSLPLTNPELVLQGAALKLRLHELKEEIALLQSL